MAKQIVTIGNRVVAHGEDCFLSMGGTVICDETGKAYPNATVTEVDAIPADVDTVGYEYHAGQFIPCAPYGKGTGNLAVFCDGDCKSLKDSGLHMTDLLAPATAALFGLGADAVPDDVFNAVKTALNNHDVAIAAGVKIATGSYTGTGTYGASNPCSLTFDFVPKYVKLFGIFFPGSGGYNGLYDVMLVNDSRITNAVRYYQCNSTTASVIAKVSWSNDGKTVSWYSSTDKTTQLNSADSEYFYLAIG